jgi:hypothetical protein
MIVFEQRIGTNVTHFLNILFSPGIAGTAVILNGRRGAASARRDAIWRFNLNHVVRPDIRIIRFKQIPQHRFDTRPFLLT